MQVGLDLIELARIELRSGAGLPRACLHRGGACLLQLEGDPLQNYAGRFAAKEAVGKALGCGVHFTWREIEVVGRPKPSVQLSGGTAAFAERIGMVAIDVSLTHSKELAAAVAIVRLG